MTHGSTNEGTEMPRDHSRAGVPTFIAMLVPVLFSLAVSGEAEAQVFFVQGEQGLPGERGRDTDSLLTCDETTCTLDRNLAISGTMSVSERPLCPQGYSHDESEAEFVVCVRGDDEMVRVGDFWIDRYESSVWELDDCSGGPYGDTDDWEDVEDTFPDNGQLSAPLYACSVSGVTPARYLTWFQAQAACTASGKHLVSNAEWQAAVAGTDDPGVSDGADGTCVTDGLPRNTGGGTACVSYWGVEDMIGNLWEWTSDWWGQGEDDQAGSAPDEYGNDACANVDLAEAQEGTTCFPAASRRGGSFGERERAGAFALSLHGAPSTSGGSIGFRCARGF